LKTLHSGTSVALRSFVVIAVGIAALALTGAPTRAQESELPTKNVTLTLDNAPIDSVLKILFKNTGISVSIPTTVAGFVTVDLHNVPFDAALRTVLRAVTPPLTYTVEDGIYTFKAKGTDDNTTPNPNAPPAAQQPATQPTPDFGAPTPSAGGPATGITLSEFEVIKLNYADATNIAGVFGPIQNEPGQMPNLIIPPTSNLDPSGGKGGAGGGASGGFGGTSGGFGGASTGGSFGGSTTGSTGGFGGTSSFGGRGF